MDTFDTPPRFLEPRFSGLLPAGSLPGLVDALAGSPSEECVFRIQMAPDESGRGLSHMRFMAHACPNGIAMADLACELAPWWRGAHGGSDYWTRWADGVEAENLCPPIKLPRRLLLEEALARAGKLCFPNS